MSSGRRRTTIPIPLSRSPRPIPSPRLRTTPRPNQPAPKAELNWKGALVLADIIHSFNSPVNEEQCWALCYQAARCAQGVLGDDSLVRSDSVYLTTELDHVLIHKDGTVHPDTFADPLQTPRGPPRVRCSDESKLISNLGVVIFRALDFGFTEDEERHMSPDLETLLDSMTSAEETVERPETDDEGIERDSGDSDDDRVPHRNFDFGRILEICSRRMGQDADLHYKAVCRAYVMEALELSTFLQKISKGTQELSSSPLDPDPELDKLHFTDWARFWVQVIRDLRQGVKLKKVEYTRGPPIEYELTPYEILMDDIRSRRYKLNKVMVDGTLPPRIKKDAHAIILEFIRSRPPLKKAAERILAPAPKKDQTPIEKLMEAIRHEPRNLAPVRRKDSFRTQSRRFKSTTDMTSTSEEFMSDNNNSKGLLVRGAEANNEKSRSQPQRKLIKVDLDLLYGNHSKDDDDYDFSDTESPTGVSSFFGHICPEGSQSTPVSPWKSTKDLKFDTNCDQKVDKRRRHSICNPTVRNDHGSTLITFPFEYTHAENVFSSLKCPTASPIFQRRMAELPRSVSKSSLQEEFLQSDHWQTAMECLSLNLDEVVHIRNVLTKAELESLPLDCCLKDDVEKGKVCFLCLKTRFSLLFGPWGNTCKLCKRTICTKCCSKMRIPTEQFANVPVSTLSPNISPRDEEKELPGSNSTKSLTPTSSLLATNSITGSVPGSPNPSRKSIDSETSGQRSLSPNILIEDDESRDQFLPEHGSYSLSMGSGPRSLPTVQSISLGLMAFKRRSFGKSKKDDEKTDSRRGGSLMIVCHDCRAMVLQIIRSSRAKKNGNHLLKSSSTVLQIPATH